MIMGANMGDLTDVENGLGGTTPHRNSSTQTLNVGGSVTSQDDYGVRDEPKEIDESGRQRQQEQQQQQQQQQQQEQPQQQMLEKDPYEVGWDNGDNDPLSPRSFSKARKWVIVLVSAVATLTPTCASSIYVTTYTQMEAQFHNSREISILGLSMFVLGLACGPMLLSPLSEFYGRRPIYLVSWSMYLIWIIPQAVAKNIETILVSRFLNGMSGSAFLAVSGGTVADLFAKHELQAPMAVFSVAPFVGPSFGPLIGGFINQYTSWRWTYYVLLIWAFVIWVVLFLVVPETYHPILIRNKARKLRKETGDDRWIAPMEKSTKTVLQAIRLSLMRPFQLLFLEPMLSCLCIYSALLLGILYLFFDAFPLIFSQLHGFNQWQVGLSFMGILVGMLVGISTDPLWHRARERLIHGLSKRTGVPGSSEPEFRLPPAMLGAVLVPIGLFTVGWTSYASVHWIAPIIGSSIFGCGNVLAFTGIFTFTVDAYPLYAASALAANAFVRCAFAAIFPLFGVQMYNKLGYHWASSLLAFLTVAMLPFPLIFFKYGKKIRGKSRFAAD